MCACICTPNRRRISMRMRKKNNLENRITQHDNYLILNEIGLFDGYYGKNEEVKAKFKKLNLVEIFGNDNPVYLEIGCGKGGFALELANYIYILYIMVVMNYV